MSIKSMFKKLIPSYTDKKVDAINKQSMQKIEDSGKAAKKLKDEGIANLIIIAIGGGHNHD